MHKNPFQKSFLLLVAGLGLISGASAAPPNVVASDSVGNTAAGTSALRSNTTGVANSAFGQNASAANTVGTDNVAVGAFALYLSQAGTANIAVGSSALLSNQGRGNSALGYESLEENTSGNYNTAAGYVAAYFNTTGIYNVAIGANALESNKTGSNNTAVGAQAAYRAAGSFNTALGFEALYAAGTGSSNTATGIYAMYSDTTGHANTGSGRGVMYSNTTGAQNAATGAEALLTNVTGSSNTAMGFRALYQGASLTRNVAIGWQAGYLNTGADNVTIGADNQGKAGESGVIRIGNKTYQKKTFIAGISGVQTGIASATAVFVDANGQLGTVKSSRRYKTDIQSMGDASDRLLALRPVTFRYKQAYDDGSKPMQFGLIAEEVQSVFPELVVQDAKGKPETVRYDLLATLLVNELQKDHKRLQTQADRIEALENTAARLTQQTRELSQLKEQVAAMATLMKQTQQSQLVAATH